MTERGWAHDERRAVHRTEPEAADPGEVLWSLMKGEETYRAELRHNGEFGVELQLFLTDRRDEHFVYGQRYPVRAMAVSEADRLFGAYLALGYKVTA